MAEQHYPVQHFLASKVRCTSSLMFGILILSLCELRAIGMVTLSPMMVAPVCRVGDPLQITCTASVEFIRWSIVVVNEHGMEEEITVSRNSRDPSPPARQRIINSTIFTFTRTSTEDTLPLISTLAINSTSIDLNGTVVCCMDASSPMTSNSTTIQIINVNNIIHTPTLRVISEKYGVNNVTVTGEWTQLVGVTYTARLSPLAPLLSTGSNSRQLILSYNTEYNFSIEATAPCRPNTTVLIQLYYANCGHPELLLWRVSDGSIHVPNVEGYEGLPIEGSTISFSCPPGLSLIGPNSATCMGNGEWEPDPNRPILCLESEGNLQTDELRSSNELAAAVSSTVIVFLVISIFIFITGFVCGHYFRDRKYKQSSEKTQDINPTLNQPAAPLYEDVSVLPSVVEHREQGLEMKENVAYGPSKSMSNEQQ